LTGSSHGTRLKYHSPERGASSWLPPSGIPTTNSNGCVCAFCIEQLLYHLAGKIENRKSGVKNRQLGCHQNQTQFSL